MHELAVCQGLLREVARVATANRLSSVDSIAVAVGPLSGVEPSLLARAFDIARMGTVAQHARLDIEAVPVIVWCESCAVESATSLNSLLCSRCGSWQVELRSGDDLTLLSVEATTEITEPAG